MDATQDTAVERFVPHRGGMLWLTRVLHVDEDGADVEAIVREDHLLADPEADGLPAWVGIEYMAQAIAAGAGLSARDNGETAARMGFLLGCRDLAIAVDSFQVGDRLTIEARRSFGENELGVFACKVQRGDEVVVEGALTVYQGPLPQEMTR